MAVSDGNRRFLANGSPEPHPASDDQPIGIQCAAAVQLSRTASCQMLEVGELIHVEVRDHRFVAKDLLQPFGIPETD